MEEFIKNLGTGEARLSLEEYNKMRDRIQELEDGNERLTEILDDICEKNKVRVRRQIIRVRELTTNPRALGQEEVIEDKLVNMEDITGELDEKLRALEKECKEKCEALESENKNISKALEQCQRMKLEFEQEAFRLKHRGWWARLWNK